MFSLFGKKDKPKPVQPQGGILPMLLELRETLYTQASLDPFIARVRTDARSVFPWSNFVAANQALKDGDKAGAIAQLKQIVGTQRLNTRFYLQAWHTLVSLGEQPIKALHGYTQGVVIENHTDRGLDITAAYVDNTARYWNYTGTGIVWEARDPEIDKLIFELLRLGFEATKQIGIELRDAPPLPPKGNLHIYIMAYDGSTVGGGPYERISKDPLGSAIINAGSNLVAGLIKKQKKG